MNTRGLALTAAVCVLAALPAHADHTGMMDAVTLHRYLTYGTDFHNGTAEQRLDAVLAVGYIQGIVDSYNNDIFCIPGGTTNDELDAVTLKFLNEHPDGWHNNAGVEVGVAFRISYPCKPKSG